MTRPLWVVGGLLAVAVGGIGIVVPGLPSTVFFIVAAWCFSKSNDRLEQWVLNLPTIGPLVRGYRAGDRMPRKAKVWAIAMIVVFAGISVVFALSSMAWRVIITVLAVIGIVVVSRA
jgi:uncharacterized membrane protein YbaN (DUF454 family)